MALQPSHHRRIGLRPRLATLGADDAASLESVGGGAVVAVGDDNWGKLLAFPDPVDESMRHHPSYRGPARTDEEVLTDVEMWNSRIIIAREGYLAAVREAHRKHIPHSVIAARVGKSEAAIRMLLRRRGT